MANQGSFQNLQKCGAGADPIVVTGDVWDSLIDVINGLAGMQINPQSNIATWIMNQKQGTLDFTSLDGRLSALESVTGVSSNTSSNTSITVQITQIQNSITDINNRLANASATANCVANTVVVAITI